VKEEEEEVIPLRAEYDCERSLKKEKEGEEDVIPVHAESGLERSFNKKRNRRSR
jgi:hypothetical protein